ncbi:hypothetical protein TPADAL_0908a [Treponema pallidum subsp. pallidum DAL-1]|uniref:Uncharacterized protein n=2 Tax=Treponema pallidum TaxID=160 RepID=A0AAU8RNI9_TREPL|nr:cytochrome c oxidase subunit 1 [Treponema pallidum subsp. pallidum str. Chicago]AEZ58042.1 hypothetical protein TPESAMD_0908a [Treponema pallidum subsp. pertenue str. SamoaD]AEZ59111.1 hypothetical protein TPECDC2_0908a [Treponema pallidum subsp. pertenue str. CDC2]AEZ60179.1 hypothetical protein TPEGAU_0908a [Treponema pallidum subsp. pertenue str. Gauthier]AEZ61239.1 hypothetical protein TPADAL_0908a [Treponema pallidum subsp. pallidum DAL-1]AGK84562.1 hypothetical protein TPFB_0908a [Tre
MEREYTLHSNAIGIFAHRKGAPDAAIFKTQNEPFVSLDALCFSLHYFEMHTYGVPDAERFSWFLSLLVFNLLDEVATHSLTP